MSDLQLLFQTNPGQLQEQRRIRSVDEMFRRSAEERAQQQLQIQRDQNERLRVKDQFELESAREQRAQRAREFEARLPGLEAEAEGKRVETELKKARQPYDIEELLSKNQQRLSKERLERMNNAGTAMSQAAQLLRYSGVEAAKKHLEEAGYGKMWNPSWDNVDPKNWDTLSAEVERFGTGLSKASQGFLQKQSLQDDAQAARLLIEETRARNARELEDLRAQRRATLQQQLQQMRRDADAARSPKTFQELAVRIQERARSEQDPEIKRMLEVEAARYLEAAQSLAAVPSGKPTIDPNIAPGVLVPPPQRTNPLGPTAPPQQTPPRNPVQTPSQDSPAQQRGGNTIPNLKAPPGRVIIYKDGKPVGTVPEAQLEEAMRQGYSARPM